METKSNHVRLEWIRVKLGYIGKLVVDSVGMKGGLCLFWDDSIDVNMISYSKFHIDAQVVAEKGASWRFTGMYGQLKSSQRIHSWIFLHRLHGMSTLLWVCAGDFNEILDDSEKKGGSQHRSSMMDAFRCALDDCGLQDLGFSGPEFTWSNKREGL
ncbi:hypothetical protein Ddye_012359 [Dipteronia dyeriana]|uniref:Endonuclease/exonuclease/phosphatase domain-containing protein n=1 Tax=Dipteronia dyeriana TaxID=168575 RepID=A0AAE0CII9_9ROSI|nr:hypothetical protein Ddye_012338 [Dipteronia dyeriana]KAK2652503.1 hypothetical protein Ddye_012359 [Dipteronia dyeriana]